MGALSILRCLCCCFIVWFNIIAMLLGMIFLLLGSLFTWGFSVLASALGGMLAPMAETFTAPLSDKYGISIDILELLRNTAQITGGLGAFFTVLGIVMIVVACIGCCGACCSNKSCLLIYAIVVGVIFLVQLIFVIIWFSNSEVIRNMAKNSMINSVKEFTGISSKNIQTLAQNLVQVFIGCCGIDNGTDFYTYSTKWERLMTFNSSGQSFQYNLTYPLTCCKFDLTKFAPVDEYCPYNNTNTQTSWYEVGCYSKMFTFIESVFKLDIIFYILGGFLGVQILLALGALLILMAIAKDNKVKPN